MAQKITLPNELKIADEHANLRKESFKMDVNSSDPKRVLASLKELPNFLREDLERAKTGNPERFKIELREIREICLLWYNLDHIEDSSCNILLYRLKPELKWYIDETEKLYTDNPAEQKPVILEKQNEDNDFLQSTIDDFLDEIRKEIKDSEYNKLAEALKIYFETGIFPKVNGTIHVGDIPLKKLGSALKRLYKNVKHEPLSIEYFRFAKQYISIFQEVPFDEPNFRKSRLYKYFTSDR